MLELLKKLMRRDPGPLNGLKLRPFETDSEEPYHTFSRELRKLLESNGTAFDSAADSSCELDWDILGGSQLKVRVAARIAEFTIQTEVREGRPDREEVDYDVERTFRMNHDAKVLMFFKKGAQKIVDRLVQRYHKDLGRA